MCIEWNKSAKHLVLFASYIPEIRLLSDTVKLISEKHVYPQVVFNTSHLGSPPV